MIDIGKPYITKENDRAYLRAKVSIPDDAVSRYLEVTSKLVNTTWLTAADYPPAHWRDDGTMWFSAPAEYEKYLCTERSDAFIVACFWYAMVTATDIKFEAPVSKKLYEGLTGKLIPALTKDGYGGIRLIGPVAEEPIWHEDGVVSGMSCGVDSQYTLKCYGGEDAPQGMRLTHLVYYDGNYLIPPVKPPYDPAELYRKAAIPHAALASHARTIAAHHGIPFIYVQLNMDRDYYRGARVFSSMYRFLSCTLALAHLYGTYISSSSGHVNNVDVSLFAPSQHYEDLVCECCRTDTLDYVSSDHASRSEKLRALADDPDAQKFLAVCFDPGDHGENCGICYACWKTMVPLDIMGKLNNFKESFDLDKYYGTRKQLFADLIDFSKRPEATSARDCVKQFTALAEEEQTEAAELFKEALESQDG